MSQVDFINLNFNANFSTDKVTSKVALVGKGKLISLIVYNSSASTVYLQVFDATALPSNGTAPSLAPLAVPSKTSVALDASTFGGFKVSNGIVWAESTTDTTLTVSTSADLMVTTVFATLAN